MMNRFAILMLVLTVAAVTAPAAKAEPLTTAVFENIRDRLALMKSVAAWKALRNRPVEDLEREQKVLQSSLGKAEAVRIDGSTAQAFFEAQIDAAKEIQSCWMDRWTRDPSKAPQTAPDLIRDIRPKLIDLGAVILKNVARAWKESEDLPFHVDDEPAFVAAVEVDCLSGAAKRQIYRALVAVQPLE